MGDEPREMQAVRLAGRDLQHLAIKAGGLIEAALLVVANAFGEELSDVKSGRAGRQVRAMRPCGGRVVTASPPRAARTEGDLQALDHTRPISALCCRNSRIVGYQGLSSRSSSHRHSGRMAAAATGLPSAPAKCATAVSTETTRSRFSMTPPCPRSRRARREVVHSTRRQAREIRWRGGNLQAEERRAGARYQRRQQPGRHRPVMVVLVLGIAGPDQADPRPRCSGEPLPPGRDVIGTGAEVGNLGGNGIGVVPSRCGRLISGAWQSNGGGGSPFG